MGRSDASGRRMLDIQNVQDRHAITVRCTGLTIDCERAAEILRGTHFVTEVVVQDDLLTVSYATCSSSRIMRNVLLKLGPYITS